MVAWARPATWIGMSGETGYYRSVFSGARIYADERPGTTTARVGRQGRMSPAPCLWAWTGRHGGPRVGSRAVGTDVETDSGMHTRFPHFAPPNGRRRFARMAALLQLITLVFATPGAADPAADGAPEVPAVPAARASASAQADIEEPSDWRELLPGLTMGSQMRLRTETRRNAKFDGGRPGNDEDYLLSRFRFGLTWEPADWVDGIVELQDARIHGERAISETRTPNIFADQLDIHQAYLDVAPPASGPVRASVRIGRQKLVYGAQRMVSPLEWVNTARVFDGVRVGVAAGPGRKIDAFATRLVPVAPTGFNDHGPTGSRMFNSQLHGVYYTDTSLVADGAVEGYWLLRRAARLDDAVHTLGARVEARRGPWAFDGELAAQSGSYGGLDHRASLVHVGGTYTTALPGRLKLGAAFNLGSGDDDPADGVHGTFDQLYPLGHAYYGYMDLFALQNLQNTEVTVEAALPRRATLRVALQDFALAVPGADAWYNVGGAVVHRADGTPVAPHVGNELDVTLRLPVGPVGLEVGYGRFFGGAYLRDADFSEDTADFFYLQTLVGF